MTDNVIASVGYGNILAAQGALGLTRSRRDPTSDINIFSGLVRYPEYFRTNITWVDEVPSDWILLPGRSVLSEVHEYNKGLVESTVLSLSFGSVVIKPIDKLHGLVPASFESYQVLRPNDIVIRPTDLQNDQRSLRVGKVLHHGIITSAYIGLRLCNINSDYATWYLKVLDYLKVFYGIGSGLRQNLTFDDFKRLPIVVPPKEEQELIVRYLAHAHQRINHAIATKQKLLALLAEERGAIETTFLPRNANPVSLRYLSKIGSGSTPSRTTPEFWEGGSIPWLNSSCVNDGAITKAHQFVTELALVKCHLPMVPAGSVLIGITGQGRTRGMAATLEIPSTINQHLAFIKPNYELLPGYLKAFLGSKYSELRSLSDDSGSTKGALTIADIKAIQVPLVNAVEQQNVIDSIRFETAAVNQHIGIVRREIALLEEFRPRLTADVVTGQVDVRDIAANLPPIDPATAFTSSSVANEDDVEVGSGAEELLEE